MQINTTLQASHKNKPVTGQGAGGCYIKFSPKSF